MLVLGEKEQSASLASVRSRSLGDIGQMSIEDFKNKIKKEIENFEIN